jgi:hypothetical protein
MEELEKAVVDPSEDVETSKDPSDLEDDDESCRSLSLKK